jgi:hypothetical protein
MMWACVVGGIEINTKSWFKNLKGQAVEEYRVVKC